MGKKQENRVTSFYACRLSGKQLNCFATSVFRKQKVRKYNETEHNFQRELKVIGLWDIWNHIKKAEFMALWVMEKEIELCFIFKTQPLKRCFHSNQVNTSSHYRPSSFLLVGLKIFSNTILKALWKNYSFSDHSAEPKMKKTTHGVLNFSCFMHYKHSLLSYFREEACLTGFHAKPWTWDLISLMEKRHKQKLFAIVFKQK